MAARIVEAETVDVVVYGRAGDRVFRKLDSASRRRETRELFNEPARLSEEFE